jgi:hypothetical protein
MDVEEKWFVMIAYMSDSVWGIHRQLLPVKEFVFSYVGEENHSKCNVLKEGYIACSMRNERKCK